MWFAPSSPPVRPGSRLVPPRSVDHPQNDCRMVLLNRLGLLCVVTVFGVSARSSDGTAPRIAKHGKASHTATAPLRTAEFVPVLRRTGDEIQLASLVDVPHGPAARADECPVRPADLTDDTADRLVGSWEDDYYGRRVMTLRPDGSGTMLVELKGPAKLIVGSKLTFHVEWSVVDGRLDIHTLGGEPANKIAMITRTYGDRAVQDILDLTANELCVRDTDDGDEFQWRRLQPTPVGEE